MIGTVRLERMEFFARHGYYDAEWETGNRYEVSIAVEVPMRVAAQDDTLSGTVNYEGLYGIAAKIMHEPTRLLESLAYRIGRETLLENPEALSVTVEVKKRNPPINGLCEAAAVALRLGREEV